MTGVMRIVLGLLIVWVAILAGFLHRSPWIIALLTVSFTVLYVGGKLAQWQMLARMNGAAAVLKALLVTLPIQGIVSGLFYLVGVGIGAIAGQRAFADRLDGFDAALAGGLLIFGVLAMAVIHVSEARADVDPEQVLSADIRAIMDEASELG